MTRAYRQLTDDKIRRIMKAVRARLKLSNKALAAHNGVSVQAIKAAIHRSRRKGRPYDYA